MKYGYIITQKAFGVLGVENGSYIQCEDEVTGFVTHKAAEEAAENRIFEIINDLEYADDEEGYDEDEFSYTISETWSKKDYINAYKKRMDELVKIQESDDDLGDCWAQEEFENTATVEEIIGEWLITEPHDALAFFRYEHLDIWWTKANHPDAEIRAQITKTELENLYKIDRELSRFCNDFVLGKYTGVVKRMIKHGASFERISEKIDDWCNSDVYDYSTSLCSYQGYLLKEISKKLCA